MFSAKRGDMQNSGGNMRRFMPFSSHMPVCSAAAIERSQVRYVYIGLMRLDARLCPSLHVPEQRPLSDKKSVCIHNTNAMSDHDHVTSLEKVVKGKETEGHTLTHEVSPNGKTNRCHTLKVIKVTTTCIVCNDLVQHHASRGKRTSNSFPVFSQSWEAFCLVIDGWVPDDVARLQRKGICVSVDKFF